MLGIDPKLVIHNIVLAENAKPVRQNICKMNPKITLQVKDEIDKVLEVGFIHPIDYSRWIWNIFVVAKLDGQLIMCMNF
jgi:hypothetical protein